LRALRQGGVRHLPHHVALHRFSRFGACPQAGGHTAPATSPRSTQVLTVPHHASCVGAFWSCALRALSRGAYGTCHHVALHRFSRYLIMRRAFFGPRRSTCRASVLFGGSTSASVCVLCVPLGRGAYGTCHITSLYTGPHGFEHRCIAHVEVLAGQVDTDSHGTRGEQ
jgi:hypothetical protein